MKYKVKNTRAYNTDQFSTRDVTSLYSRGMSIYERLSLHETGILCYISIKGLKGMQLLTSHDHMVEWSSRLVVEIDRALKEKVFIHIFSLQEYVLYFPNKEANLDLLAETIHFTIRLLSRDLSMITHIGFLPFEQKSSPEELLKKSYAAMTMHELSDDSDTFELYDEGKIAIHKKRFQLAKDLQKAIDRREIHVVFQPILEPITQQVGFEALARWVSPTHGSISPGEFIPLAEENGVIAELTKFVVAAASHQLKVHPEINYIAVNLSSKLFDNPQWYSELKDEFETIGTERIHFELTEGLIINTEHHHYVHMLQEKGHKVYIDDFGTGYSSLSYLIMLGADGVKLDRFFTIYSDQVEYEPFINKTVELAKSLNLKVIIEGVETQQQKKFFTHLGCDGIQGYLEAKPMSPEMLSRYLDNRLRQEYTS